MGTSKTEEFKAEHNRLADLAKAFSHPARVAILEYLIKSNACQCSDIVEELPLSQSTVSQHLKELKRIGIIQGDIKPPRVCYCINPEVWQECASLLNELFGKFNNKCC